MPEVTKEWLEKQAKQLIKKYWDINEMPTILLVTRQSSLTIERKLDWDNCSGCYCTDIKSIVLNNEKK